MKQVTIFQRLKLLVVLLATLFTSGNAFATHAQSADITYQCLGGNQYRINVSFYRDCAGVAAPNTVTVNLASASCNQSSNVTLSKLAGTGQDVTQVCNTITTQCNGGTYPGVQEYKYTAVVTLAAQCTDWVFSFSLCCRNNAINTINNPGGENIYVEAQLNNLNFTCNNSPSFSNPPVSYPCIGQTTCFNHGIIETDGDSLYYSLLSPATGPTTSVTYIAGYSATQPLISNPLISFNSTTGDICMSPTMLEVTVLAVKVEEWRNGILVGSVIRDIQLRTVLCNNDVPTVSGINGTGQYSINACVGSNLSFTIPAQDINTGQTVTLSWNNAIAGATFTSNNLQIPTATFSWSPTLADVGSPHCFTVTVQDNNCPLNGVQVYAFCITVSSLNISTTSSTANCGASNGSATVTVLNGTPNYTYQWTPNGGINATQNGLQAGVYTINVTDAMGCTATQNVTIGSGAAPGNINITGTNVSCYNGTDGTVSVNVNGGQQPYTYSWSNGSTAQNIQNLPFGFYQVTVTTANGCVTSDSINITQPASPLSLNSSVTPVSCNGQNNGSATVSATGGTFPYLYNWNTTPTQNTAIANNLLAGTYMVTVTDNNGCVSTDEVNVQQPSVLSIVLLNQQNVACNGLADGMLNITVSGGVAPYQYNWNGNTFPNTPTLNNLTAGTYNLVVTDANGCSQNSTYSISEPTLLSLTISSQTTIFCNGYSDGSITTTTTGGTSPYQYLWNNGLTTANITNLTQGNYTLNVTDGNGCTATVSTILTEPSFPLTSTINVQSVSCFGGNNGQAAVTVNGGTSPYSYTWNVFPTLNTSTISNLMANNYQVTITDANGCSTSNTANISQPTELVTNLTNQQNITCNGINNGVLAVLTTGGTVPYSYSWNNGTNPNLSQINNLGQGIYHLVVTDANGCSNTNSYTITEPTPLTATISSQNNISCYGFDDGAITTNVQGGTQPYHYVWNNGSTNQNLTNLTQGNYPLTISDENGCTFTLSSSIVEPEPISTIVTGTSLVCPGENITLTANSTGGTGNLSYVWSNGSTSSNTNISTYTNNTYSVYSVDANGCHGPTIPKSILVNDINLASIITFGDTSICFGELAEIFATFTPGLGTYTFNWNNGLGTGLIPIAVSPISNTNYEITVTDNCGNMLIDNILVEVHPLPEVLINPQSAMDCEEVRLDFHNNYGNPSGSTYHWSFGDNTFSTEQTPQKSYHQTGNYVVTLIVTSPFGCTDLSTNNVNVIVNPVAIAQFDFSPNEDINTNNATLYFYNYSTNTNIYKWNFGDGLTSTEIEPVHTYQEKGTYEIALITNNNYNCADTMRKEITIDPAYNFYIPNAFTPDKDGLNEVFTAKGEEIKEFSMEIFNRWGEKIYETNDIERGWDGTAKDGTKISQQDVFVYDIRLKDYTGKLHTLQGKVTLIK